jgi:hypothetical protein
MPDGGVVHPGEEQTVDPGDIGVDGFDNVTQRVVADA